MSKTLLIYERAVPINKTRHGSWGVKVDNDFSFAKKVNSMPLLAQEFRSAVREYPIVFAGVKDHIMPAILLGFREDENLFVDETGKWVSQYIPAFARRYPYVFSSNDQGKTLTLCIDEEFSGLNQEGEGERLFTDDGEQTSYLKGVLEFQTEFQRLFQRTQAFCKRLQELELLEPMQAQLKLKSGEQMSIGGFMAVNRERVKELPAATFSELAAVDELELVYLHLQSMQNVQVLARRIKLDLGDVAGIDDSTDSADEPASQASADKNSSAAAKTDTSRKKKSPVKKKTVSKKLN